MSQIGRLALAGALCPGAAPAGSGYVFAGEYRARSPRGVSGPRVELAVGAIAVGLG